MLIEEQARVCDTSWGVSVHSTIVAHYLLAYGTEEQKKTWLPKMASGEVVGAIAMTEPGTGSDLQNVKARATRDGDEYVVNGSKTFITNGQQADLIITVVKTDTAGGAGGISLVLVESERVGFRRGRSLDKIGQRGQDTSELFYDDVRIPVSNLLGTVEGQGFVQLMQQLPQERLIIAVGSVAGMETALEHTLRYTKERQAFGRPIFGFRTPSSSSPRWPPRPRSPGCSSTTASNSTSAANWTSPPWQWPSGGPPTAPCTSPTNACNCSAGTAT